MNQPLFQASNHLADAISCQFRNSDSTTKDHKCAAKATLAFAGRIVVSAVVENIRLYFNLAGVTGGSLGAGIGGIVGVAKGCYQKAVHKGSEAAKKPLSEYMIKAARTGYLAGDIVGRGVFLGSLQVTYLPVLISTGAAALVGAVTAAVTSPVVYCQSRDYAGYSSMAKMVEDKMQWLGDEFDHFKKCVANPGNDDRKAQQVSDLSNHISHPVYSELKLMEV